MGRTRGKGFRTDGHLLGLRGLEEELRKEG